MESWEEAVREARGWACALHRRKLRVGQWAEVVHPEQPSHRPAKPGEKFTSVWQEGGREA